MKDNAILIEQVNKYEHLMLLQEKTDSIYKQELVVKDEINMSRLSTISDLNSEIEKKNKTIHIYKIGTFTFGITTLILLLI